MAERLPKPGHFVNTQAKISNRYKRDMMEGNHLSRSIISSLLSCRHMKVLTFAWDYPPETTGGLGMACHGLVSELGAYCDITFVLPRRQRVSPSRCNFIFADVLESTTKSETNVTVGTYSQSDTVVRYYSQKLEKMIYGPLFEAARAFADRAHVIAQTANHDLIHAHDWSSYLAGMAAKAASGKPLVIHVHATAYDQAGGGSVDPQIFAIEQHAFAVADSIAVVSNYTKTILVERYCVDPEKIEVVYNGAEVSTPIYYEPSLCELKAAGKRIVLYHGRITIQKGLDHLIRAARLVVDTDPNVLFIVSGSGDMEAQIMQQVGELGLSENVRFAGALWYEERDRMYQSADLVVMPSVSEPFGLVPLEAIRYGTPVIVSKQSGVAEVLQHALKVDFWDVEEMANKILAASRYPIMYEQLKRESTLELLKVTWHRAAEVVRSLYEKLTTKLQQTFA